MSLVWFVVLAVLLAVLKTSWFKGVYGEFMVNAAARLRLDSHEYRLIKNVMLPTDNGTTQIDHIIVSIYGVFVVETKNMKGWIFGAQDQPMWTQKIYRHSEKFQNPLRQNYKHVKTLEQLLGLRERQLHSLVVFVGNSVFKTPMPENVTRIGGCIRYIKSQQRPVLSPSEVEHIIERIGTGRLPSSFKTRSDHVKHVRSIVKEKQNGVICPRCGAPMVRRTSKNGQGAGRQFWGCSRFPECRGIVNITQSPQDSRNASAQP